ncbi:hypothetical protein ACLVWU_14300 [Bdellovibrio sp. HCB290]|uniref:hypothetical protein n=1 Tax=Bdellovibrio sp. HCB290 TaxID=3394356 RepID=UPI0039B43882
MAYRYESVQIAEKKSTQVIMQAIGELALKAERYAQTSGIWSAKALAATAKARQILGK